MHGPNNSAHTHKPSNTKGTVKRLIKYIGKQKSLLVGMIVFVIISSVATVMASVFIQPIVDDLLIPAIGQEFSWALFKPITKIIIMLVCAAIIGAGASYGKSRCSVYLTQKTLRNLRKDLFDSVEDLPINFFDSRPNGEIMSRFTNDVESLRAFLSQGLTQLISSSITIIGSFCVMLYYSWKLTILVVLMVAFMIFLVKVLGKKSSYYFKKQQKELGEVNGYIEETIEGQKVVKVFNHEEEVTEHFTQINEELRKASTGANTFASILMPLMNNLSYVNYAITAALGGMLAVKGFMTPGGIVAFLTNSRNFSQPITQVSQQFNNAIAAIAGAERIFEYIDEKPEVDDGYVTLVNAKFDENGELCECEEHTGVWAWKHQHTADGTVTYKQLKGDVVFENVTFSYDGKKTVLKNISLYAKPGQKIALVGSTGAGKTTITNLLNRFYEIDDGKIRYDGINIKKIKKDDLRRSLSMVLQDTHLFTGTVEDNIRYGNLNATHEQIVEAAKLANAHSFIMSLENGYDTVLTGDGANLSQGQRQLLSIARAAVADPPVLVLDEATSSIDTRTEKLIEQGTDKLMQGRTVFVIAHRLSTVRNSNAIMVLEHGEIIERGDHEDLLKQKGRYYQLYTGQFELS
ncbi:MAG: ABC transporter ATP-binding protein/permease [Ruminococcus sp.]|nr:ABC transporter ATP-binding protein/permease [Ruminococcus sp.]MDY4909861.1 ABC transporter ATP-binding protein [Candidatus Fimenecus sp.]